MARCTMSMPCGSAAFPDRAFNQTMEIYGLPQRRYWCVAGHTLMVGLPDKLPAPPSCASEAARKRGRPRGSGRAQSPTS